MRRFDKRWLLVLAMLLLVGLVWMTTIKNGKKILTNEREQEEVPYHSNENGNPDNSH